MQVRVIGDVEDVIGFGLAGIEGLICDSPEAVICALDECRVDGNLALVIVSAEAAARAPEAVTRAGDSAFPLVVVLPPASAGGSEGGGR